MDVMKKCWMVGDRQLTSSTQHQTIGLHQSFLYEKFLLLLSLIRFWSIFKVLTFSTTCGRFLRTACPYFKQSNRRTFISEENNWWPDKTSDTNSRIFSLKELTCFWTVANESNPLSVPARQVPRLAAGSAYHRCTVAVLPGRVIPRLLDFRASNDCSDKTHDMPNARSLKKGRNEAGLSFYCI